MVHGLSESLIDAGDHFDVDVQIPTQTVDGLEQIEPLEDRNLPPQAAEAFAPATARAFHIAPTRVENLEGPTKKYPGAPVKSWPYN